MVQHEGTNAKRIVPTETRVLLAEIHHRRGAHHLGGSGQLLDPKIAIVAAALPICSESPVIQHGYGSEPTNNGDNIRDNNQPF